MKARAWISWRVPTWKGITLAAVVWSLMAGCSGNRYVEPTAGPTGRVEIASICTQRATFYAEINGRRTERYGCNETASWLVAPGPIELLVQVEQAEFTIQPLVIRFEVGPGQCARFLLRQADGYELEFFSVQTCE